MADDDDGTNFDSSDDLVFTWKAKRVGSRISISSDQKKESASQEAI